MPVNPSQELRIWPLDSFFYTINSWSITYEDDRHLPILAFPQARTYVDKGLDVLEDIVDVVDGEAE